MKTAIIIGGTGLVGQQLVNQLLASERYGKLISFSRRSLKITNAQLEEHVVDFDDLENWKSKIKGDDLYSALGTTIKKAGSKKVQYKIDYSYQFEVAKAASENGVKNYALVSAAGANDQSRFFYNRIKGELDKAILELGFHKTCIVRPSVLDGSRKEKRPAEQAGLIVMRVLSKIPGVSKYKPTKDKLVAKAMIKCLTDPGTGHMMLAWKEIITYAEN